MKPNYNFPKNQERLSEIRNERKIMDLVIYHGYTLEQAEKKVYKK